jgi:GMP synthase-like glutamine amidotransferase
MSPKGLKIAILINTDEAPYTTLFHSSYQSIFSTLSPQSTLTFFHPILAPNTYPNPLHYDLLIVGGGTYVADEEAGWVQNELAFLRKTVEEHPRLKVVGICFGHQKLCQAFGGQLSYNKSGKAEVPPPSHSPSLKLTNPARHNKHHPNRPRPSLLQRKRKPEIA